MNEVGRSQAQATAELNSTGEKEVKDIDSRHT